MIKEVFIMSSLLYVKLFLKNCIQARKETKVILYFMKDVCKELEIGFCIKP